MDRDKHIVFSFFREHPLMTLSTVGEDGVPQSAVVYVYMDDDMNCYCASRTTTRKYENIGKNSTAVLSTFDENVLMFGELRCEATIMGEGEEVAQIMPSLQKIIASRKSSYWVPPVAQLEGEGYVFFKLTPKKVLFVNYEQSSSDNPHPHKVEFEM